MDFKGEVAGRFLRIIAVVTLALGLADAARLLGVGSGPTSPLTLLGPSGFAYLTVFCLARLFAAVGLWIRASWGAVLLFGATAMELVLSFLPGTGVVLDAFGFGLRALLLAAIVTIFVLSMRLRSAHD